MRYKKPDAQRLDHIRDREKFLYDSDYLTEHSIKPENKAHPTPSISNSSLQAVLLTLLLAGSIIFTANYFANKSIPKNTLAITSQSPTSATEPALSAALDGDLINTNSDQLHACSTSAGSKEPLRDADLNTARVAWKYFENNFNPTTGFVNSIHNHHSTTMWDTGSSLGAYISAKDFGLITQYEFDQAMMSLLKTLGTMKMLEDLAPNIVYNTQTANMIDYAGEVVNDGIGASVLDLSRLAFWLNTLQCMHPKYYNPVNKILSRWDFSQLVKDEEIYGIAREDGGNGTIKSLQQGRLGYEQYAGKIVESLGFSATVAASYTNKYRANTEIMEILIAHDNRDPRLYGINNFVVTDSYTLDAMELGLDEENTPLLKNIYQLQKKRWQETGIPTAISDDNINQSPYYLYNTIFSAGLTFTTTTDTGVTYNNLKTISTKSAFSLATLFPEDDYSDILMSAIESAYDPKLGWYSGVYEDGGYNDAITAHTNGVILGALLYKKYGALLPHCEAIARKVKIESSVLSAVDH